MKDKRFLFSFNMTHFFPIKCTCKVSYVGILWEVTRLHQCKMLLIILVGICLITAEAKYTRNSLFRWLLSGDVEGMKNKSNTSWMLQSKTYAKSYECANVPETLSKLWHLFWGSFCCIIYDGFTSIKWEKLKLKVITNKVLSIPGN